MTPPNPGAPPGDGARPKLTLRRATPALDQQPEREAVRHTGVDGVPVAPVQRRQTLGGMPAPPAPESAPPPPRLPLEHAETKPAPANPLRKATWRVPTPPSAVALARRSDHPAAPETPVPESAPQGQPDRSTPLPPPSRDPAEATILAARRRAEAAEARLAELERRDRIRAETEQASFPPPVMPAPAPKPTVEAEPAVLSWLIASATRNAKAIKALVAAFGIAGGGAAITVATDDKPAVETALRTELDAEKRKTSLMRQQLDGSLNREAAWQDYTNCLAEQQATYFAQLLPATDRMGSADKPKPFLDKCKSRKP